MSYDVNEVRAFVAETFHRLGACWDWRGGWRVFVPHETTCATVDGLKISEAAESLRLDPSTVRKRVARGMSGAGTVGRCPAKGIERKRWIAERAAT